MAVNIRVRNFQSIEDAEIEVSGFTVVTGQNNSGKTAVMRAVRGVFENSGGDAFVRHGTDAFAVHLDFGDADVTWSKGPKVKPTYVVGGKTINPGRAVPDEVTNIGIAPVQAGSGEVWPQIAPQFTGQVFLLDMPGSAIAEVVSDVDRVSRLTEALRYADSDKRSANADLKLRRKDRDDAKADVARFDGLDAATDVVVEAERVLNEAAAAEGVLADVTGVRDRMRASSDRVRSLSGVVSVSVPDASHVITASSDLVAVRLLASSVRRHRDTIAGLTVDVSVPSADATTAAGQELASVRSVAARLRVARTTVSSLPSGVSVPDADAVRTVAASVADVRKISNRLSAARAAVRLYERAAVSVPDTAQVTKVASAITTLGAMSVKVSAARSTVADLERRLADAERMRDEAQGELDAVIVEVGSCPTCGS
ncbi:MAG: hypothetical protein EBT97_11375, partial [Actinobacteria bacterium]|nr:hypothetical protein [Actinomycetota bacterium]